MKLKFGVVVEVEFGAEGVEGGKEGATGAAGGGAEEGEEVIEVIEVGFGLKPFKIDNKD